MTPGEMLDLSQLIRRVYNSRMDPVCQRLGVTRMEMDVLLFLANNPGHDTASELVALRALTKSHVSTAVNALIERGMLSRDYRDGNRKTAHLRPLEKAQGVIDEGLAVQQALYALAVEGFSREELSKVDSDLQRLMENLRNHLE